MVRMLVEGKNKQVTFNQYKAKLKDDEDLFNEIVAYDPTYDGESETLGDYAIWLLNLYCKNKQSFETNKMHITDLLSNFKSNKTKLANKDINSYKSIEELEDALANATQSARQKERAMRNSVEGYDEIASDDEWTVYSPLTYEGSLTLGKGTHWCTADSRNDYYYKHYTSKGKLFIFINNKDHKDKFQWHPASGQCLKPDDHTSVKIDDFLIEHSILWRGLKKYDTSLVNSKIDEIITFIEGGGVFTYVGDPVPSDLKKHLRSIEFGSKISEIENSAFSHCANLKSIEIPDGVTSIGNSAFSFCSKLTSIIIPDTVTKIGTNVFEGCGFKSIEIPETVTEIGWGSFKNCKNLETIKLPSGLTQISSDLFQQCLKLKSIDIPQNVTEIGIGAFFKCTSFVNVNIPNKVTKFNDYAFAGCTNLKNINIPESVKEICELSFTRCTSLVSISIPGSVKIIRDSAFEDCKSLTSVKLGEGVTTIDGEAFANCPELAYFEVPSSLVEVENDIFSGSEQVVAYCAPGVKIRSELEDMGIECRSRSAQESYRRIRISKTNN